jgi:uncharacterized protein (DUF849 family)
MINRELIINFCPTGMVPDKEMTPHVPISVEEIVEQTHEAYEMGITIAHFHARDESGKPSWKKSIYRDIFEGVRKHCPDLIICGSTSGRLYNDFEKRSEVIELQPDMCSLTLSSLNFSNQASVNSPEMIQKLLQKMNEFGVNPELECFGLGMINYGLYLKRKKMLPAVNYWNLLFGNVAGFQATYSQIGAAIVEIPKGDFFALGGLGKDQLRVSASAIAMGYGIRIGLEDNIWWDEKRTRKASNRELLQRAHQLMEVHGHRVMSSKAFGKKGFYNRKHADV